MKTDNMSRKINNPSLFSELMEKFPPMLKTEWWRYRLKCEAEQSSVTINEIIAIIISYAETVSTSSTANMMNTDDSRASKGQNKELNHHTEKKKRIVKTAKFLLISLDSVVSLPSCPSRGADML